MAGYGAEQPVPLAVNSVGEVECVGTAIIAADPEINRPKAARATAAGVDWERSVELPIGRVEGVDFALPIGICVPCSIACTKTKFRRMWRASETRKQ